MISARELRRILLRAGVGGGIGATILGLNAGLHGAAVGLHMGVVLAPLYVLERRARGRLPGPAVGAASLALAVGWLSWSTVTFLTVRMALNQGLGPALSAVPTTLYQLSSFRLLFGLNIMGIPVWTALVQLAVGLAIPAEEGPTLGRVGGVLLGVFAAMTVSGIVHDESLRLHHMVEALKFTFLLGFLALPLALVTGLTCLSLDRFETWRWPSQGAA